MKLSLQVLSLGLVLSLMSCGKGDISALVGSWVNNEQTEMMSVGEDGKVNAFSAQSNGSLIGEVSEKEKGVYELKLDSSMKEEILKGKTGDERKQAEQLLDNLKYTIKLVDSTTLNVTISVESESKELLYTKVNVADRDKVLAAVRAGNLADNQVEQTQNPNEQTNVPGFGKLF